MLLLLSSSRDENRTKDAKPTFKPEVKSTTLRNSYSHILNDPNIQSTNTGVTEVGSSYKSLPRNYTSATTVKKWTLLDTEMAKEKGIIIKNFKVLLIFDSKVSILYKANYWYEYVVISISDNYSFQLPCRRVMALVKMFHEKY